MEVAPTKAQTNANVYGIPSDKMAAIMLLVTAFLQADTVALNPDTATAGARRARDDAREALEPAWRKFLNENIRYNTRVPVSDLEVFRIWKRDTTRTPEGVPDTVPALTIARVGTGRYEIEVLDGTTGKKKRPKYAAGSVLYMALTAPGQPPQHADEYRKLDFSSNCHHVLEFSLDDLAKQANLYARYVNTHGKEGPISVIEAVVVG
jgi:hypothetical protein